MDYNIRHGIPKFDENGTITDKVTVARIRLLRENLVQNKVHIHTYITFYVQMKQFCPQIYSYTRNTQNRSCMKRQVPGFLLVLCWVTKFLNCSSI